MSTVQSGEPQTTQSIVFPVGIGFPTGWVTWMFAGRDSSAFSAETAAGMDLPPDDVPVCDDELPQAVTPRVSRDAHRANDPSFTSVVLRLNRVTRTPHGLLELPFRHCPAPYNGCVPLSTDGSTFQL